MSGELAGLEARYAGLLEDYQAAEARIDELTLALAAAEARAAELEQSWEQASSHLWAECERVDELTIALAVAEARPVEAENKLRSLIRLFESDEDVKVVIHDAARRKLEAYLRER